MENYMTKEQINERIENMVNSGIIQNSVNNNSPDISGGCDVFNNTAWFKDANGNFTMILNIDDCETFLSNLGET
jgi:hypothetical protein